MARNRMIPLAFIFTKDSLNGQVTSIVMQHYPEGHDIVFFAQIMLRTGRLPSDR